MSKKGLTIIIISLVALIIGVMIGIFVYMNGPGETKGKELLTYNTGIEDLYCNIKDSKKVVKINMVIETKNTKLNESLESKKFLIRDLTNEIVVSKTDQDLLGEDGQAKLKKEILARLEEVFKSEEIINIYFNDFIIQ